MVAMTTEIVFKAFRAEVIKADATTGEIDMKIPMSTPSKDRTDESILPEAFKKHLKEFMKRPILLSSHDYFDLRKQIGEFKGLKVSEEGLIATGLKYYINEGNEEADWAFNLASKGMAAFSVGFIPIKWEKLNEKEAEGWMGGNRKYTEVELLEISQVVVPANREAIQGVRGKHLEDPIMTQLLDDVEKEIVTKPEETEEFIRVPNPKDKGNHEEHKIRTIDVSAKDGIKALYCVDCKIIVTYLFNKAKEWTMEKAKEWVKEHSKGITQGEVKDELDYLIALLNECTLNTENIELAKKLEAELRRFTGSDISVDITPKLPKKTIMEIVKNEIKKQLEVN